MDVDAIDVAALSPERRQEMQNKGLCFRCGGRGHMAQECATKFKPGGQKNQNASSSNKKFDNAKPNQKWKGKELYTHIRGLTQDMDDEERELFISSLEDQGF